MFLKLNRRLITCLTTLAILISVAGFGLFAMYGRHVETTYVFDPETENLAEVSWQMAKPRGIERFDEEAISYGYISNTLKMSVPMTEPLPDYDTEALTELVASLQIF